MRKGFLKRALAALTAVWMLLAAVPAAMALPEDWEGMQIYAEFQDEAGNDLIWYAVPVEGMEGIFWMYVQEEALSGLTLHILPGAAVAAPEENVRAMKQKNITAAALKFLHQANLGGDKEIFFDVVAVVFDGERTEVKYFPQAWIPTYL